MTDRRETPSERWQRIKQRPSPEHLRAHGKVARSRVTRKVNKGVQKSQAWWDEIEPLLRDRGWSKNEIARSLGISAGRVRQITAEYNDSYIHVAKQTTLQAAHPEMAPFTAEAFELFFNRYSGMVLAPHSKAWVESFIANRHLILNVPPRHAKSTIFSTWIPVWLICRDRNTQIILVSETHNFAARWCKAIADQLDKNHLLISELGRFTPEAKGDFKWAPLQGELIVRGRTRLSAGAQLTLQSRGMDQQILGMEADFVIIDDPTNQEISRSETKRQAAITHLREQVFSRRDIMEEEGVDPHFVVVGQRVHPRDLYGELANQVYERGANKGQAFWHVEMSPAVIQWPTKEDDSDAIVLWPDRWTFEELMISYELVGGYLPFETLYQQNPAPEGAMIFQAAWLEACKDMDRPGFEGIKEGLSGPVSRVLSIDPSPDNYHGIVVADLIYDRDQFRCFVVEAKHIRSSVRDLIGEVRRIVESYEPDWLVFEVSGFAKWFFEDPYMTEVKNHLRVVRHTTGVNKHHADFGVQSLAGDFEYQRINLPYGDAAGKRMTDLLVREAQMYPDGDHDDVLMALWFIKFNFKRLRPPDYSNTDFRPVQTGQGWSFMEQLARKERQYAS